MANENSLYSLLCRLFTLISKCESEQEVTNSRIWSSLSSPEVECEANEKRHAIRNGFKTLLSSRHDEEEFPDELQIPVWLFKLSYQVSNVDFDAVQNKISELEQSGQMKNIFPVLKFLFSINPVKNSSIHNLKGIQAENFSFQGVETQSLEVLHCIPYKTLKDIDFDVPSIDYQVDQVYTSNVIKKLGCTQQFDELDVAHRNLFGVLENPPKTLNYLGISKQSKLCLGIKNKEDDNFEPLIAPDEEYEVPFSKTQPFQRVEECSPWEDLDNLCDSTKIRRTWEAKLSGQQYPDSELPYLSHAPIEVMEVVFRHFENSLNLVDETLPDRDSYYMEETEFKRHLLYLLLGIESKAFTFQDEIFRLNGNPFIKGISTDCLSGFIQPLLECGQLVRRLNKAVWDPSYGPVRNALADQLLESLQLHQQLVKEVVEDCSVLAIVHQLKELLPILQLMNQLWTWPGWESESGCGVAFLQHLVDLSTLTSNDKIRSLLTAYFTACVDPFLSYIEHWLYNGHYCDPHKEFFIQANDEQLSKRDRNYWVNGFIFHPVNRTGLEPFTNATSEEDAIIGLLNDIYLCGKTVHLLHLCQAKELAHGEPSLRLGLSLCELNDIKSECEVYALKSPSVIQFVEPVKDLSQQARKAREAKLTELVALKEAKEIDRAVKRSERHALAKAELDEQLEMKKTEEERKKKQDQLLDEDIQRYRDTVDQRDAMEKRRLIMKYARLLDDQESLKDSPLEDELNANNPEIMDEDNNMISVVSSTRVQSETPTLSNISASAVPSSVPSPIVKKNSSYSKQIPNQTHTISRDSIKKSKILTREEIKTKVLWEEFGVDPRYTKEDAVTDTTEPMPFVTPYVSKDWDRPNAVAYPIEFTFDIETVPQLKTVKRNWLQQVEPSEEEIRDLSLSFFVQRSLLLPIRTQCQIVNRSLMALLIGPEHRFMQHLEALRQYLFLDNGPFSHSLVNSIGRRLGHLTHITQLINIPSMNFILQSALNAVHADEYHASRLSFYIKEATGAVSNSQLEALECFTLRYRVGWPLNLILTEEVMDDYSQIFSFVLQLRLAAWALEDVYIHLKNFPCRWHAVHIARYSLYHFVQSMQNYVMSQLLTLAWTEFLAELKKNAHSLDDLYDIHSNYVHRAKSRLLLTPKSASLMKIIRDALNLALRFRGLLLAANFNYSAHLQTQINAISVKAREYAKFIRLILVKVNDRSHQSHLSELLLRLSFNDYYTG